MSDFPELPSLAFGKLDMSPDPRFYASPRLVTHIDQAAVDAVTDIYRRLLPPGGVVLDLMSSWVSHLPDERGYAAVVGHGMNAEELAANPRLTDWFVQDLNVDPVLPMGDAIVDAATMCVSVQYLQTPVAVFREVVRVLRPGGCLVVTFSNRCFPTKAVTIWGALDGAGHVGLVTLYFQRAGFERIETENPVAEGRGGDPLHAVIGWTKHSPKRGEQP